MPSNLERVAGIRTAGTGIQRWLEPVIPLMVACALFIAFAVNVPNYLSSDNLQQLMRDFAEPGLIAVAMAIVILAGGIDLSVGATFAIANFTALFLFRVHEFPLGLTLLSVMAVGAMIGTINGLLVAFAKARPFLTTLAMLIILRAAFDLVSNAYTAELANAIHDSAAWEYLGAGVLLGIPTNMIVLVAVAAAAHLYLTHVRPGLHLMAVGGSSKAARHAGIHVRRVQFTAYLLCSVIAAVAGLLYAARQNSAGSDTGLGWEIAALTAVMLGGISLGGGRGSVVRAVMGAAILFLLVSGLLRMNVPGSLASAVMGLVLLVAVGLNVRWTTRKRKELRQSGRFAHKEAQATAVGLVSAPMSDNPVLQIIDGNKLYGGIHALNAVDIQIYAGEIHALLGENGAGKSTLAKIIAGATSLSSGMLKLDGVMQQFHSPADALKAGVAMVYQETSLVPAMSVAHNLQLGSERWITYEPQACQAAEKALRVFGIDVSPLAIVEQLSLAERQMVEIARVMQLNARVIIFDEPTASLSPAESQRFFKLLQTLRERSVAIIFITHALEEALQISDRITVLRDGKLIKTAPTQQFNRAVLIQLMVGRVIAETFAVRPERQHGQGIEMLRVEDIRMGTQVNGMSFSVHAGEVVGIAGLVGAGRTEMAKIIAGELKRDFVNGGKIYLKGKAVRYRSPAQAVQDGVVYITEDRKANGFFETMTVDDNIYLGALAALRGWQLRYLSAARQKLAEKWVHKLSITALNRKLKIIEYSGGNQQKVVLAKALAQEPEVVIFDEPTRGVDVGAIPHIHAAIRELAKEGRAVIVISSYLPEILSVSDRILVARLGRIAVELEASEADEQSIMGAAAH